MTTIRNSVTGEIDSFRAVTDAIDALTLTVSGLSGAASTSTSSDSPAGKGAPVYGTVWGADVGWGGSDAQHITNVAAFDTTIGTSSRIDHQYFGGSDLFPIADQTTFAQAGKVSLMTWQPSNGGAGVLGNINTGVYDRYLNQRAVACRDFGRPLLFRPMHEMNGNWYDWSGSLNGGSSGGSAAYVSAFQRIWKIFQAAGAYNVSFVWAPNATDEPTNSWNHWTNYYPGDQYVDIVGWDGYNFGTSESGGWRSFASIFDAFYQDYGAVKPIMLTEVACAENGDTSGSVIPLVVGPNVASGDKGAWITAMHTALTTSYPSVAGVVWFNEIKERHWNADSSAGALAAFQAMVTDPLFRAVVPEPGVGAITSTILQADPTIQALKITASATALGGGTAANLVEISNSNPSVKLIVFPDGGLRVDGTAINDPTADGQAGAFIGQKDGNRRIILNDGTGSHTVQVDNNGGTLRFIVGGNVVLQATSSKPAVTGSRGGNAALASLLTALAGLNLITDSTSA